MPCVVYVRVGIRYSVRWTGQSDRALWPSYDDTITEGDMYAAPGVDLLKKYTSKGRMKELAQKLADLERGVVVPAVDGLATHLLKRVGYTFNVPSENRSVTEDDWIAKAITRYSCGVHNGRASAARGVCSCNRRDMVRGTNIRVRNSSGTGEGSRFRPATGSGEDGGQANTSQKGDGNQTDDGRQEELGAPGLHVRRAGGKVRRELRSGLSNQVGGRDGLRHDQRASYRTALSEVHRQIRVIGGRRRVLPLDEVVDEVLHGDTFSGLPSLRSNADVLETTRRNALRVLGGERGFDPYLYGRRVQSGVSGPKTRLVWMAPSATTVLGQMFSKPIQDGLARHRPFTWGLLSYEKGAFLSEMVGRFEHVYQIDYSRFDSSVPAFMLHDVFTLFEQHLDMTEMERVAYWKYVHDFIHTRIVLPDGNVYQVHKGIPSGASFTSLVGSVVNLLVTNYIWHRATGRTLSRGQVLVMGDDSVVASDQQLLPTELAMYAGELGFVINTEKSVVAKSIEIETVWLGVHFLGHVWFKGRPHRDKSELARRMSMPERHHRPSEQWSLVRIGGYSLTSAEGLDLMLDVVDSVTPVSDVSSAIGLFLSWIANADDEVDITTIDWPGPIRLAWRVEGRELPELARGKGLASALYAAHY
jgi:hypothetical protein